MRFCLLRTFWAFMLFVTTALCVRCERFALFFVPQNMDKDTSVDLENGEAVGSSGTVEKKKPRLRSLDTLRGSVSPDDTSPVCSLSLR